MPLKTVILCRTNGPLVKFAFALIARKVKVKIVGRDIAKVLKDIIGEVLEYRRNCDIDEFTILLKGWIDDIRQRFGGDESKDAYVSECEDIYACLLTISERSKDAKGMYTTIDHYFVDSESLEDDPFTVVFASGHRSKGLEWERVIWICPDLCPHPSAESEADRRQEEHLKYILGTRAMKSLIICHDSVPV